MEVLSDQTSVVVSVGHFDPRQVPTNGQAEEDNLEGGDEELEQEESRVTVDPDEVLPALRSDVDWVGEARERAPRALAGGEKGGGHVGS